jgi:uncharacterized protein (DUF952 family)
MRPTFHLVPAPDWAAAATADPYRAASLDDEGFIHCTDGSRELVATANRHYRGDPRPFVVLAVDLDRVTARWSVEDPAGIYPHVYGPIDRAAIMDVAPIERDPAGRFLAIGHGPTSG